MDGGIKTLGLHLCATGRERSAARFWLHFRPSLLCIQAVSAFQMNALFAFGKYTEITMYIRYLLCVVS